MANLSLGFSTPNQVPLINGVMWSFAHITLRIVGVELNGAFKSIKYSRKRDRDFPYSNNPDPVGKTLGENKYTCVGVLYNAFWFQLLNTLQNNFGPGYGDAQFPIYVSYNNNGFASYTDTILNCSFDGTEADNEQGNAALTRSIDFGPTKILFNGIDDLAKPLGPGI